MRLAVVVLPLVAMLPFAAVPAVDAQQPDTASATPQGIVRLYLDCVDFGCDQDFIRTEIGWVNHVRDRQVADVHVLITEQRTAGGGEEYTLDFIGRQRFAGRSREMVYTSGPNDTDDDTRRGLARVLKLGLISYASQTRVADGLEISYREPDGLDDTSAVVDDPWNFWTLRVGAGGGLSGESSRSSVSVSASFSADRVTEEWKILTGVETEYDQARFEVGPADSTRTIIAVQRDYEANGLVVRSLGPHWSAGGRGGVSSSTRLNQDLTIRIAPAVEYNIYPYDEATRRQLVFQYSIGANSFDYNEETIFGQTSEILADHALLAVLDQNQPWGSIRTSLEGSQHLHDFGKYRLQFDNNLELSLFQGFSLDLRGNASLIRDQIYLSNEGASDEEILLELRQLATSYEYWVRAGLSYRFGSIFSNVVNPRF